MALNIGDKTYRTIQEQVAKNQSDILELARASGRINPILYIETEDVSGTFSDDDFAYIAEHKYALICFKRPLEYIYYGIYKETSSTLIYISLTILSSNLSINEKIKNEILSIDKNSKTWAIESKEIDLYSDDQADNRFPKIYYASDEITNLTATDIKAIVDGGFKLVMGTANENMVGYVLQGYIGVTDKYYLNILVNYQPAVNNLNYVVDGDTVSQTSKELVSNNHYGNVEIDGDLLVTGKIIAGQPDYEFDLGSMIEAKSDTDHIFTNVFSKIIVNHNILSIVITYKVKALVAGSYNPGTIDFTIPQEIGEKIIDFKGKNLTQNTYAGVCVLEGGASVDGMSSWGPLEAFFCNHYGSNTLQVRIGQSYSYTVNEERYHTLRTFLLI